jgi:hypothetical protein
VLSSFSSFLRAESAAIRRRIAKASSNVLFKRKAGGRCGLALKAVSRADNLFRCQDLRATVRWIPVAVRATPARREALIGSASTKAEIRNPTLGVASSAIDMVLAAK